MAAFLRVYSLSDCLLFLVFHQREDIIPLDQVTAI